MVSYRISTPPNEIVYGAYKEQFKSPALQCQTCKLVYHPTCAQMQLYYMVRYTSSSVSFACKQFTEKFAEYHWTDTVHLFKDCYSSFADIENTLERNESNVPVEAECIESRENSEASRQNL